MKLISYFFLFAMLVACGGQDADGDISAIDPNFFNMKEFVETQKELMAGTSIKKTVSVNGIEETKDLVEVDWALELAPFEQSNIDKAALWDTYQVDTLFLANSRFVQAYTSLDSANFTKTLQVEWSDTAPPLDSIYAIQITNGFDSYIANTKQLISWWNGGYEIISTQDAVLSDRRELKISAEWDTDFVDPFSEEMTKRPAGN